MCEVLYTTFCHFRTWSPQTSPPKKKFWPFGQKKVWHSWHRRWTRSNTVRRSSMCEYLSGLYIKDEKKSSVSLSYCWVRLPWKAGRRSGSTPSCTAARADRIHRSSMQREAVSSSGKQQITAQQLEGGTSMSTATNRDIDILEKLPWILGGKG